MEKKKIALHLIMPKQTGGPNTANRLMVASEMKDSYDFCFITQNIHSGNKFNFKLLKDLKRQIKTEKPDLLHFSGLQASGFYAVLAARLAGYSNIIVTIRGTSRDDMNSKGLKNFILSKIMEPLTLRWCRGYYTVCTEMANRDFLKKYRKKKFLGTIYNAAPTLPADLDGTREARRAEIGLSDGDFAVVTVGRMCVDKGIDYILQATRKIKDPHVKFVFIGDGPYEEILRKEQSENPNIIVLGKRTDVIYLVNACDLFLFGTLHENLSNALLEAMSVGLPVVATAIGGNVEVVENEVNGYLIPAKDADAITEKVTAIAGNRELCQRFSAESRRIISEKFTQSVIYGKIMGLYETMLSEK